MSEEASYYLRFIAFFIDVATETALQVVNFRTNQDIKGHLTSSETKRILLELKNKGLTETQYNHVSALVPNPHNFDFSLLIKILCDTGLLPERRKGSKNRPCQTDLSLSADIWRLRDIRNSIVAHKPRAALNEIKFERLWKELEDILLRITVVTAPGTEEELKHKIRYYKSRNLDAKNDQKNLQKLEEWRRGCEEISKLQEKVEELVNKCNEFALFFRRRPKEYSCYIRLLFEGGRLVLSKFLIKQIVVQGHDLRNILLNNQNVLEDLICNQEMPKPLFQTNSSGTVLVNIDTDTWDILVLAHVVETNLQPIKPKKLKAMNMIKDARINYAETALISIHDARRFSFCCEDLVYAIRTLASSLDEDIQEKCDEQIQNYRTISAIDLTTNLDDYLSQLKLHEAGIKNLSDVYQETVEKLKKSMNEMEEAGICFKNDHVLDLKMITLGKTAEKKTLAENALKTVWHAALKNADNPNEFEAVRQQVDKILECIRNIKGLKEGDLNNGSILFSLTCSSPNSLVQIMDYLTGELFEDHMDILSRELGYINDTVIRIEGHITFESLQKIIENPHIHTNVEDRGLNLPLICSSPEVMREVFTFFGSKETTNRVNQIADALSVQVGETISVKLFPDPKGFSGIFDDTDNETTSSSDSQIDCVEYYDRYSTNRPDGDDRTEIDDQEDSLLKDDPSIGEMVLENKEPKPNDEKLRQGEIMMSGKQYAKYQNWVKAAIGFQHVREGLEPFCDDIVKQQHADILENAKQRHNLMTAECGQCDLRTLQPDHVHSKYQQCPLGQNDCNCQYPSRMAACPKNVCGTIYDEIINLHASTPPCPYWKNTDVKHWCSQPWAIAKCFINAPGYTQKSTASEIDCYGLLHLLINNKGLQKHIHCMITGMDVFSRVLRHSNTILHSENMELEDAEVVAYIDDMIDILQDGKELKNRNESKYAVQKLFQLKQHDSEVKAKVYQKGSEDRAEVLHRGSKEKAKVDQSGSYVWAQVYQKRSDVMANIDHITSDAIAEIEQTSKYIHKIYLKQCVESDEESKYTEMKKDIITSLLSSPTLERRGVDSSMFSEPLTKLQHLKQQILTLQQQQQLEQQRLLQQFQQQQQELEQEHEKQFQDYYKQLVLIQKQHEYPAQQQKLKEQQRSGKRNSKIMQLSHIKIKNNEENNETTTSSDSHIDDVEYADRYFTKHSQSVTEASSKTSTDGDDRAEVDDQEDTLLKEVLSTGQVVLKNEEPKASDEEVTSEEHHILREENKRLRELQICKVCLDKTADVAFMPCGHLVCCQQCALLFTKCPICGHSINTQLLCYMKKAYR